jgi:uncharacterized repeat protein (TIGR01451 family)
MQYVPKKTAIVSLAVLAILVPAASFAYGPSRHTYTIAKPADHVTFDSITDNPNIGDERNFVSIREDGSTGAWQDSVTVQPGKTYVVREYVHNDAASNLKLTARDVTTKVNLPTTTGKSIDVFGYIDSRNAIPNEIYDQATFKAAQNFNLAYVNGSLLFENNVFTSGTPLSENIFTSKGVKLGYKQFDGNIPGCMQYAGYVSFKVKPQFAQVATTMQTTTFTFSKQISKHGANTWSSNYAAQPGETVDFLLQYKNTGTTQQNNVVFKDTLPTGMTYVPGSTTYGNALYPSGIKASDNVTTSGINVGDYKGGGNAWAIFSATTPRADTLQCGTDVLTNTGQIQTDNGNKNATASVSINKVCVTTPPQSTTTPPAPTQTPAPTPTPAPAPTETPAEAPTPAPTPLPSTGPSEVIGGALGTSSLGLGVHHYMASRRAIRKALLK